MTQENNVSPLQQHLGGGDVSAWETELSLRATVGFPYSTYKYSEFDWDSELEYDNFIDYSKTASSVSGTYFNRRDILCYYYHFI